MTISTTSRIFCTLAQPGADMAGVLYNELIAELDVDGLFLPTSARELAAAFHGVRALGFSGFAVSMPYKMQIMQYCDSLTDAAKAIGAVNTVRLDANGVAGENTDWFGAVESMREHTTLKGKRVLLLGAGGAARAIAYGLFRENADVTVANRDLGKARQIADSFGLSACGLDEIAATGAYDIIVNATSVGFMNVDAELQLAPTKTIENAAFILDAVFTPLETKLLRIGRAGGAQCILGSRMLVHQAIMQFDFWGHRGSPDVDRLEQALIDFLSA